MGREIKRVALDFDWPLEKIWKGYINPYDDCTVRCRHCEGKGESPEARRLRDIWYGFADFDPRTTGSKLLKPSELSQDHPVWRAANRKTRPESEEGSYYGYGPEAAATEAQRLADIYNTSWSHNISQRDVDALLHEGRLTDLRRVKRTGPLKAAEVNEWSIEAGIFGHDAINAWICIGAHLKRKGISYYCKACRGQGCFYKSRAMKRRQERWKQYEPPTGEGWQIWETVSEGSPVSPVCATDNELISWMVGNRVCSFKAACEFVKAGWVMSGLITSSGKMYQNMDAYDAVDSTLREVEKHES